MPLPDRRVVIIGPKDVQLERNITEEAVGQLNRMMGDVQDMHVAHWQTDTYPRFHLEGTQGAIDEDLRIQDAAVVVAIFAARLGTPTHDAGSGTEHELRTAVQAWKENGHPIVLLYFNKEPKVEGGIEGAEQFLRLQRFIESLPKEAPVTGHYRGVDEFRKLVPIHLAQSIRDALKLPSRATKQGKTWRDLERFELHTFCGLRWDTSEHEIFQDFRIDDARIENPNPVSFMWADAKKGSSISTLVDDAVDPPHLKVSFENKTLWPSNVAIRPRGERAVKARGKRTLSFEARVSPDSLADRDALADVVLTARVINGWCQHWAYGPGAGSYLPIKVNKEGFDWIHLAIQSQDWWQFNADGNRYYGNPECDLSTLCGLILAFGAPEEGYALGRGRSSVLIRNVCLRS